MWLCENCVCVEEGLSVRRNVCGCKDGRLCLRFVQQVTILCLQNQQFTSEKTQHSAVFKEVLNIRFVLLPFFGLANKIFLQQENYYFSAFSPLEESQSFHPLAEWLAFRGGEVQESGRGGRDHRLSGVGRYRRQGEEVGTTAFQGWGRYRSQGEEVGTTAFQEWGGTGVRARRQGPPPFRGGEVQETGRGGRDHRLWNSKRSYVLHKWCTTQQCGSPKHLLCFSWVFFLLDKIGFKIFYLIPFTSSKALLSAAFLKFGNWLKSLGCRPGLGTDSLPSLSVQACLNRQLRIVLKTGKSVNQLGLISH